MMEEENGKKKKIVTALAIATVIIYVGIFMITDKQNRERSQANSRAIVTDYSEFYTVTSCANKYLSFLSARSSGALVNVLAEEYKKANHIDESNVLSILSPVAANSTFTANRMYFEKMGENTYKYYLKGYLETGELDYGDIKRTEYYLIVYVDKENTVFQIEPYDGVDFKEGAFE